MSGTMTGWSWQQVAEEGQRLAESVPPRARARRLRELNAYLAKDFRSPADFEDGDTWTHWTRWAEWAALAPSWMRNQRKKDGPTNRAVITTLEAELRMSRQDAS